VELTQVSLTGKCGYQYFSKKSILAVANVGGSGSNLSRWAALVYYTDPQIELYTSEAVPFPSEYSFEKTLFFLRKIIIKTNIFFHKDSWNGF
jgi:hypothetical protein